MKQTIGRTMGPTGRRLIRWFAALLVVALCAGGCTLFFDTDPGRAPVTSDAGTSDDAQNGD